MNEEFKIDPSFKPVGPLISPNYVTEPITKADIIVASVVWALTLINAIIAIWVAWGQTKTSKSPLRSVYVWMIWLELLVCFLMGLECFLHLLKLLPPSFMFYFTILTWWCIQVQLLLQIIINRIRIIVPDRKRSLYIMVGTAIFVTLINITVFCIWIPARLQISHRYEVINEYWDRTEKFLYLIVDACLNWYFLKTCKANLIANGLTKYNKLVNFNQRIVAISLLMDVMIIAAMSIPNSFVYIQFHPLAYLVKLNIEMTMANLIKRIALSTAKRTGQASLAQEFKSSSNVSSSGHPRTHGSRLSRNSIHELANIVSFHGESKGERITSFVPTGNQIKTTQEITITREPRPGFRGPRRGSEVEITGNYTPGPTKIPGVIVEEVAGTPRSKSLDSATDRGGSVRSDTKRPEDSDDEIELVQNRGGMPGWGRGRGQERH